VVGERGHSVFRATMPRNRFCILKAHLRFVDPLCRDPNDFMDPVRDVTTLFIRTLRNHMTASEYVCDDEQLVEFHGRVRVRQYIPSKPGKYGIHILDN
jgi:hypothetical protein